LYKSNTSQEFAKKKKNSHVFSWERVVEAQDALWIISIYAGSHDSSSLSAKGQSK